MAGALVPTPPRAHAAFYSILVMVAAHAGMCSPTAGGASDGGHGALLERSWALDAHAPPRCGSGDMPVTSQVRDGVQAGVAPLVA